jgi:transcription antitermination factor NusG
MTELTYPADLRSVLLPCRRRASEDRWHVLHSKSRQEKALAASLSAMRIDCYVPLRREMHLHGGRRVEVAQPVFPSYVFLWGDRDQAFEADRTRRVANVIPVNDQDRLEWELANLYRALSTDAPLEPFPALQAGVRARVASGPFVGIEGVVASRIRPERLVLQIRMLGTATSLEIGGEHLEVLDT